MLVSAESQVSKLISREIIFAEFERVWSQSTNATDGRTDGQTDRQLIMAIPRYATLRAVKMIQEERVHDKQTVSQTHEIPQRLPLNLKKQLYILWNDSLNYDQLSRVGGVYGIRN